MPFIPNPPAQMQGAWRLSWARQVLGLSALCALAGHGHAAGGLTTLSLEQLLDVTIVGASKYEQKQNEVAAAVSVITRDEIRAFGWRTLAEAMVSLPGVHTTYDRQYTYLGMRGFGLPGDLTARVLITVNGNRVNDPVYDGGPAGREFPLDLDLVERIEFIPGPGGAVYGQNAMLGVVNLVTRTGAGLNGGELALAAQGPQSGRDGRVSWGKVLDNGVDIVLSASGLRARGEDRFYAFGLSGVSGVAKGMDGERDAELFARVARGPWAFDLVHGNRRKDDPTASFFSDPLVAGQNSRDVYSLVQLQYHDSFAGDTLQLNGRVFYGAYQYRGLYSYGTPLLSTGDGTWHGAELRLLSTALTRHKLMAGMEVQRNAQTDQSALDLANAANSISIPKSGYRIGLYVQDEWRLADSLVATLGLRIDRNDATGTHTSPRAALVWQAQAQTTFKALAGRAHRAPNVYEKDYFDGVSAVANPALGGERMDTLELVADHRVGDSLGLRASLYRWKMHDLITQGIDPFSGLTQFQAGGAVGARGLELSADKTWNSGARLRASAALQNVASLSGARLPNSPRLLGKLNFSAPIPAAGLRLGYELQYTSRRLSLDGSKLPGNALSNLHLSTEALAPGLELSISIRNLFNRRYLHPGADINWQNALEQDGRSIVGKLVYRF